MNGFEVGDIVKVVEIVVDYQESYSGIRTSFKNHVGKIIDIRDVGKLPLPSIKIRFNLNGIKGYNHFYDYIFYPDELVHASKEEIEEYNAIIMAIKI
jgi:hypothetical protein